MPFYNADEATLCACCTIVNDRPCKAQLLRLHDYWNAKRGLRSFPAREDIDPAEISDLLPNIFLIDVLREAPHFRYRLSGTGVDEIHGQSLTGKSPRDINTAEVAAVMERQYHNSLAD